MDEYKSAQELLLKELPNRTKGIDPKLRAHLTGVIEINLLDKDEKFLFDWRADEAVIKTAKKIIDGANKEGSDQIDCTILLNEENLLKIMKGDLNPQIAMLSHKVQIKGQVSLALYFFNLFLR